MKNVFVWCGFFLLALGFHEATAQGFKKIDDPTKWKFEVKKTGAEQYDLIFRVKLEDNWHVFSQKPGEDFLIPPSFSFEKQEGVQLVGKVKEKGTLKVERIAGLDNPVRFYEKEAFFIQSVKAKPGTKIRGEYEYQVCSDKMCLPPLNKPFEFELKD